MHVRTPSLGTVAAAALFAALLYVPTRPAAAAETEVIFNSTSGVATWTVPAGVTSATFEVVGARGGKGLVGWPSGKGAKVIATIPVTPGEVLQINVGGQGANGRSGAGGTGKGGWNGGGDGGASDADIQFAQSSAAGGGGASDVRRNSGGNYSLAERLIVAGGGGGNSYHFGQNEQRSLGGDGGGLVGLDGLDGRPGSGGGGGGGKGGGGSSGGVGGDVGGGNGQLTAGANGVLGQGGAGGDSYGGNDKDPGGGGGGGYYGGGGGGGASQGYSGGGGGGGSSFGPVGAVYTTGVQDGNGSVKIRFTPGPPTPPAVYDLAVTKLTVPKLVTLKGASPSVTKRVSVTIQNRSPHNEVVSNLAGLVTLSVQPLVAGCPSPTVALHAGKPNATKTVTLKPKKTMTLHFDVTFTCAVDPAKTTKKSPGHSDFKYVATVHHSVVDGNADTHTLDDVCPRPALPGGVDANPDGKIKDKGCGGVFPDKSLGADVVTDVFVK